MITLEEHDVTANAPVYRVQYSHQMVAAGGFAAAVAVVTVTLPAKEVAEYAGRYADLGQALTFAEQEEGMELTIEQLDQPGAWQPAIMPPPTPPTPMAVLATDLAVVNQTRLPFVRATDGRVGWVATGLRLLPRVAVKA